MAKDKIKLVGTWRAWDDQVRQGRMVRGDGSSEWVFVRRRHAGLKMADKDLRRHGRIIARVDHPNVLQLLHITRIGDHPVWVYKAVQAVSFSRLIDVLRSRVEVLPLRASLDAVAAVAQGVAAAMAQDTGPTDPGARPEQVVHPGTTPQEILVDATGDVWVAGFVLHRGDSQFSTAMGYSPPTPGTPEQTLVYGLGALVVHLLAGERPGEAPADPGRHNAMVRRALIRVLARPGESAPDDVVKFIRTCLAIDPAERPSLDGLLERLRQASAGLSSTSLGLWAPNHVPGILQLKDEGYPSKETGPDRHLITDSIGGVDSSFEVPPVRRHVPREIPTLLAKPGLMPELSSSPELTPAMCTTGGPMPTLETDVPMTPPTDRRIPLDEGEVSPRDLESIPAGWQAATDCPEIQVGRDIAPDDEWDDDLEPAVGLGGWPLVGGAVLGMVVAVGVAWSAFGDMIDPMHNTETTQVAVRQVEIPPEPESAPAEVVEAEPEPEPTAPPPQRSAPPPRPVPAPPVPPTPSAAPPAVPAPSSSERFPVTFRSADPNITRIDVLCHRGRGSGSSVVRIPNAGRGPCRVIGTRGENQLVVSAVLTEAKTFVCFSGGRRVCE